MNTWDELVKLGVSRGHSRRTTISGVDVRGLRLARRFPWGFVDKWLPAPSVVARKLKFSGIDFTGCNFECAVFHECEFIDCEFRECGFVNGALFNCRFSQSRLSACDLRNCAIAESCRFEDVVFDRVDFRNSSTVESLFRKSEFNNCNLMKFSFRSSSLDCCSFAGALNQTEFINVPTQKGESLAILRRVDFSAAKPCDIRIFRIALEDCMLPETDELWYPTRQNITSLFGYLAGLDSMAAKVLSGATKSVLHDMHEQQDRGLLYIPVLKPYSGALALLSEARSKLDM